MRKRKIFLFLLMYAISVIAMAQKSATIKNFSITTDHIPGNERRNDLNGNPCALVKIQVIDDIDRIEGNKIGGIVNRGVEKWVYMCKGSRNMRIHLKNHLPVKVMFQDYKINGLESNRVYELTLEIPDAPVTLINSAVQNSPNSSTKQRLTINYSPKHAMVLIDSKPYSGNGKIEVQLPIGEHDYVIAAEGYITAEASVKLTEFAPRVITETLTVDPSSEPTSSQNLKTDKGGKGFLSAIGNVRSIIKENKKAKKQEKQKKKSSKPKKNSNSQLVGVQKDSNKTSYTSNEPSISDILGRGDNNAVVESIVITPPYPLNETFKYTYDGVTFKCKAKKGYVTITSFDTYATNVIIPSQVQYNGHYYPVKSINTFVNGNNYSVEVLIVQNGIESIERFSFAEFRKLKDVTLPSSIKSIGKKAFRINPIMTFHLPEKISENLIRLGREIIISR